MFGRGTVRARGGGALLDNCTVRVQCSAEAGTKLGERCFPMTRKRRDGTVVVVVVNDDVIGDFWRWSEENSILFPEFLFRVSFQSYFSNFMS